MNKNKRAIISLPSDREILITRVFDAPRQLVFEAHTDPALIPLWWGPRSTTTIVDRMDVRPGGGYRFIHRADDGSEYIFSGEFCEVEPPRRLVQTSEMEEAPGSVLETITFEEQDGRTTLTLLDLCQTKRCATQSLPQVWKKGWMNPMTASQNLSQNVISNLYLQQIR